MATEVGKRPSVAEHNVDLRRRSSAVAGKVAQQDSWIERKLKPTKITARYPIKGAPLLYGTCAFGSLGDALFGYNSGKSTQYYMYSTNKHQVLCPAC